jgi:hypothetical protein
MLGAYDTHNVIFAKFPAFIPFVPTLPFVFALTPSFTPLLASLRAPLFTSPVAPLLSSCFTSLFASLLSVIRPVVRRPPIILLVKNAVIGVGPAIVAVT